MNLAEHHKSVRGRIYKNLQEYPHPSASIRALDRIIFVVGALGPISTIPQIYTIFAHHDASGVSPFTWSVYFVFSFVWLAYGIIHKEKAIVFTYCLWIIANGLVALGAVLY